MPDSAPRRRLSPALRALIVFIVAFDLAFLMQKWSGAYDSEFGAHPDEAAHCVTGLFVRDAFAEAGKYVRGGFHGSPAAVAKEFADEFYQHYPKVALGVWPPAFYVLQAAWTFPFGASRFSLMLLMAALAAGVATIIFEATTRRFGTWPAVAAVVVWMCG